MLAACVTVGGEGKDTPISGSAGADGSQGTVELTRCAAPVATVTTSLQRVNQQVLVQVGLGSDPLPALRLIMQQSNCVRIVHRDVVLATMQQERALAQSGELQNKAAFGKGQLVAADYTILPEITFADNNTGGVGLGLAQLGGFLGLPGAIAGGALAGMRFKEAQVLLTLVDNRTGVQLAVVSGRGSGTSFGGLGGVLGTATAVGGGYSNTNEGKVVMAAMVDALNKLVPQLKASVLDN
jgi:hypothetical protein